MTPDDARALALGLPDVVELPHHGFPSRTGAAAHLRDAADRGVLRVMLDEGAIREAVAEWHWCRGGWWGDRLMTVEIVLADAEADAVAELLDEAHARARG